MRSSKLRFSASLANNVGQKDSTCTLAALTNFAIFSAVMEMSSSCRITEA
uniref:60S acidic ribosomal protein P1 isoform X4 n=1 Tax=Rhizophora mucronata TaxID=61149 RepID=A0A2P2J6R1_RHIMU